MRVVRVGVLAAALSMAAAGVTACTSTTSGSGAAPTATSSGRAPASLGSTAPRSGASIPSTDSGASPSAVPKARLTVTGATTHVAYDITVWDHDDLTDCSTHAYGTAMVRFLGGHPCRGAHRVLATIPLNGRTVAVSAFSTSFAGTPADPYDTTSAFIKLEEADGTGGVNDLLREGGTLPGAAAIPSHEAFTVLGQDQGVTVFDAWYLDGTTADQAPALVTLEQNLFLTPFTVA